MNQLTEIDFRERLGDAMPGPTADGPLQTAVDADLAAGRRLLRRRRRTRAVLGVASVVALGAFASSLPGLTGADTARPREVTPAAGVPTDEVALLEACRTGSISADARAALWGPGQPTIRAASRTERTALLVIASQDDSAWASCIVMPAARWHTGSDPSLDAVVGAYWSDERSAPRVPQSWGGIDLDEASTTPTGSWRSDCAQHPSVCDSFTVNLFDRLPVEVASVEVVTGDGQLIRVPTRDGFYALRYVVPLPEGMEPGSPEALHVEPVRRVTYLDASGTALAATRSAGPGDGDLRFEPVPGLPPLEAYPSRRGDDVF